MRVRVEDEDCEGEDCEGEGVRVRVVRVNYTYCAVRLLLYMIVWFMDAGE